MATDKGSIEHALKRLCSKGAFRYWIEEQTPELLELTCVTDRAAELRARPRITIDQPLSDMRAEALIEILHEVVGLIRTTSYGRLLWTVLDLDRRWTDKSTQWRRERAGEIFRAGESTLSASTIRQVHEPKAVERLTMLLLDFEARHKQERAPFVAQASGPPRRIPNV